jgi:hypothetical protein
MKLELPKITAVCMQGVGPNKEMLFREINKRLKLVLPYLLKNFKFHDLILLSPENPNVEGINYIYTKPLTYDEYNTWCLHNLSDYVNTDYCILFQDDGFPLNPECWRDEFLDYDYVGTPITEKMGIPFKEEMIGGGGFTLRSKKLIEFTKSIPRPNQYGNYLNEDTTIVVEYRDEIVDLGMKICPRDIAKYFSLQNPIYQDITLYNTFGFHGRDEKLIEVEKIINQRMEQIN